MKSAVEILCRKQGDIARILGGVSRFFIRLAENAVLVSFAGYCRLSLLPGKLLIEKT